MRPILPLLNPEITHRRSQCRHPPGILVSVTDLRDLEMLLEQTVNTGIDVYTHSGNAACTLYPAFKNMNILSGNYGNAR